MNLIEMCFWSWVSEIEEKELSRNGNKDITLHIFEYWIMKTMGLVAEEQLAIQSARCKELFYFYWKNGHSLIKNKVPLFSTKHGFMAHK